jgi:hypothetical protein
VEIDQSCYNVGVYIPTEIVADAVGLVSVVTHQPDVGRCCCVTSHSATTEGINKL